MSPTGITVVTGFLGAGKTTLVNYVLNADHGYRGTSPEFHLQRLGCRGLLSAVVFFFMCSASYDETATSRRVLARDTK